jgi:hypothetical protein
MFCQERVLSCCQFKIANAYEFMAFVSKHGIPVIDDYDIEDELNIARTVLR